MGASPREKAMKRGHVSVRDKVYEALKRESEATGKSIAKIVEEAVAHVPYPSRRPEGDASR